MGGGCWILGKVEMEGVSDWVMRNGGDEVFEEVRGWEGSWVWRKNGELSER